MILKDFEYEIKSINFVEEVRVLKLTLVVDHHEISVLHHEIVIL